MSEFIDVGHEVMRHIVDKEFGDELTEQDYEKVVDRLLDEYLKTNEFGQLIINSVLFRAFQNAKYFNNNIKSEDRFAECKAMLDQWRDDIVHITRQHHPYLSRQNSNSYYGAGRDSLPVSGKDFLASQAFVLGCWWLSWGLLAIWSDNREVMYKLAGVAYSENRGKLVDLHNKTKPEIKKQLYGKNPSPTQIIAKAISDLDYNDIKNEIGGLRAFVIASGGSSTKLNIYEVPNPIFNFLLKMGSYRYEDNWQEIISQNQTKNGSLVFDYLLDSTKTRWIIPYCFIKKDKALAEKSTLKTFIKEVIKMHDRDVAVLDDIARQLVEISKREESRAIIDELQNIKGRQLWDFIHDIKRKRYLQPMDRYDFIIRNPNFDVYTARQYLVALMYRGLEDMPWFYEFVAKDKELSTTYTGE